METKRNSTEENILFDLKYVLSSLKNRDYLNIIKCEDIFTYYHIKSNNAKKLLNLDNFKIVYNIHNKDMVTFLEETIQDSKDEVKVLLIQKLITPLGIDYKILKGE